MGKVNRQYRENDWFDLNLDVETRTIYMGSVSQDFEGNESGVDNFMSEFFIKGMHILETKSQDKGITILMNNPGGEWYHGMAIYDAIKESPCHCMIKVYGQVMSMGAVILQAADTRILMPNTCMMIHYGYSGYSGHTPTSIRWSDETKKMNKKMEDIFIDSMMSKEEAMGHGYIAKSISNVINSQREFEYPPQDPVKHTFSRGKTKFEEIREVLRDLLKIDTIISAEETVSLGLADEIFQRTASV
jgi:ATP-dependent protease ClpP protease subunit